jgi:hypothetical protein
LATLEVCASAGIDVQMADAAFPDVGPCRVSTAVIFTGIDLGDKLLVSG